MYRHTIARFAAGAAGLAVLAGGTVAMAADASAVGLPKVTNLRISGHAGFDRAVVDLTGPGAKISTSWVEKAYNCASSEEYSVPGKKFLQVIVERAEAHSDSGRDSTYVGPGEANSTKTGLKNLKGVRMTCDFEGQVGWVLGFDHKAAVSTGKLTGPNRFYVDVKH